MRLLIPWLSRIRTDLCPLVTLVSRGLQDNPQWNHRGFIPVDATLGRGSSLSFSPTPKYVRKAGIVDLLEGTEGFSDGLDQDGTEETPGQ